MIYDIDANRLNPAFKAALDALPDKWAVVQGFRSPDEQDTLYRKGRDSAGNVIDASAVVTQARAFQSAHTVTRPLGDRDGTPDSLAADVARVGPNGERWWDYTHPDWAELRAAVDASPDLHGGWHFPTPDDDHLQSVSWPAARQQLQAIGKW